MHKILLVFGTFCLLNSALLAMHDPAIRRKNLDLRIAFWKMIYTKIDDNDGVLHDRDNPHIIYTTIHLGPIGGRKSEHIVRHHRKRIQRLIRGILKKRGRHLTLAERNLIKRIGTRNRHRLRKLLNNIRVQRGMQRKFKRGMVASQPYLDGIKRILVREGIPTSLSFLPHVESSFNLNARSTVGAAGIWQLMPRTARAYGLVVNSAVDERLDPLKSTQAAARYLRDNYRMLRTWPLAISAYNVGPSRILRAVKKLGTRRIAPIITRYRERRFGFASKNFYTSFLAAVDVGRRYQNEFSRYHIQPRVSLLRLPTFVNVYDIARITGFSTDVIANLNPALTRPVMGNRVPVPKDYQLRIPITAQRKMKRYLRRLAVKLPNRRSGR